MKPLFAINSIAKINGEDWKVMYYHRVGKWWEVMFRHCENGTHTSIPIGILETHAK